MNIKEKIKRRQESNLQILDILKMYVMKYPDIRFGQALSNLNIIEYNYSDVMPKTQDPFHDESIDILERVENTFRTINNN